MKKVLLCILSMGLLLSCGVPAHVTPDTPVATTRMVKEESHFIYWKDDHGACQRQTDRAFRNYIRSRHLNGQLKGKRLVSIRPGKDNLQATYLFRLLDGSLHKVVFQFDDYTTNYKTRRRK